MEWKWTVEAIIALCALIVSIISIYKSNKASETANKLNKDANILTQGQVEIQIREMISAAKSRYIDVGCRFANNDSDKSLLKPIVAAVEEEVCNAYDEACMKYLDNKVDIERFKKNYFNEIKNLVEDENTREKYIEPQTKFHATVEVYKKWNNLEQNK